MAEPLYFGCWGGVGHHLRRPDGSHVYGGWDLDGPYCPYEGKWREGQPQGQARLTLEDERTVLSFWDRTVDSRGGSHSTFVLPPGLDFAGAVIAARAAFPAIWQRLDAAGVVVRLDTERFGGVRDRRGS